MDRKPLPCWHAGTSLVVCHWCLLLKHSDRVVRRVAVHRVIKKLLCGGAVELIPLHWPSTLSIHHVVVIACTASFARLGSFSACRLGDRHFDGVERRLQSCKTGEQKHESVINLIPTLFQLAQVWPEVGTVFPSPAVVLSLHDARVRRAQTRAEAGRGEGGAPLAGAPPPSSSRRRA